MTEKFTQGEWRVRRYKDDPNFDLYDYLIVETVADEPLGIAAMYQRNDIESEANAALIAAAPEMYSKLKTVLALCEGNLLRKTRCDILGSEIENLLKKARGEE